VIDVWLGGISIKCHCRDNGYPDIFEVELQSFCRDESLWPKTLHYKTFLRWFDIQVHSMVFDPYDDEIVQEKYFGG